MSISSNSSFKSNSDKFMVLSSESELLIDVAVVSEVEMEPSSLLDFVKVEGLLLSIR